MNMTSDTKSHVQSNVLGFEDILSNCSGDSFTTPRNSLNSTSLTPTQRHLVKTTTIVSDSAAKKSRRPRPDHRSDHTPLLSPSICDKCGECESCQRRRCLNSHKKVSEEGERKGKADSNVTSPFQPEFLTGSTCKASRQSKWETVRAITETLIKEKDMLIERQKLKRLQLEQQVRDLESRLRKVALAQATLDDPSSLNNSRQLEKEEQTYRRMMSSTQLLSDNNSLAKVLFEKSQLERQLGEAEHKIAELKCLILTQKSDMQQQLEYHKKLLNLSQEQEHAMERKQTTLKSEGDHAVKELSRLRLYLADLPTSEEFTALNNRLSQTNEELNCCREHVDSLVVERSNYELECERLSEELGESNDQVVQLLSQVSLLQKELSVWEQKEMIRDTSTPDDIIMLKEQQLELHSDYEDVKQMLESKQQEFVTVTSHCDSEISDLTSQLEHSELLLQTAQQEATEREDELESLHSTIAQLKTENEQLVERSLADSEKVQTAEKIVSDETCKLEQSVIEEIVYCTSSLECLVEIYNNPHSLDLAEMLATRPTPVTISSPREYVSVLEQQNSALKGMGEKIEKLRQFILDKYADDMASSGHMECATQ